ncbi:zeta toxin-domain-containing protein [Apiosordaria backusii]|uniref:Zeta toxin-domain-containing protein n=1 Tax=Apiosordaria backusii TaxID=314023 RepID=A0AA40K7K1_9PEZI|nr:zeta toxin-domain-containing protein [Apiosordaria backusii]
MADNNPPPEPPTITTTTTPPPKTTLSSLPPSWHLTDQQHHEIFTTKILPLEITPFIPSTPPSTPPTAIILLGQTGSGKTRLAPLLSSALSPSSTSTSQIPVLVESACRHPSDFSDIAQIFSKAGYTVKVVILAAPAILSRLGVLMRYHNKLPESMSRGLPLRLTPKGVHDESYVGCVHGAKWVDDHPGEVSSVVVVRRSGLVAYQNDSEAEGGNGKKWKREPNAEGVLNAQRKRGLMPAERELAEKDLKALEGLVSEGKVEQQTVEELRGLLKELDKSNGDDDEKEKLEQLDIDAFVKGGDNTPAQQPQQEEPEPKQQQQKSTKEILDEIEFDDDDDINFYNTCSCCR